jgi:cysteine desulfurase
MNTIYLDYAAATPVDAVVFEAMQPYFSNHFYNPSAQYLAAREVALAVDAARQNLAGWIGARPTEIIFTAGGTEANNLAIHGIMQRYKEGTMLVSALEHEASLKPAEQYQSNIIPVDESGRVDLEQLEQLIDDSTVLISVMYANNEIGTIQPLRQIAQIIEKKKQQRLHQGNTMPLYFHTDAAQAANYLDLHASRLGVDLLSLNGGKIYGPKQSGALYVKTGVVLKPLISGGGQERGLRSGTESVVNIIGLAAALDLVQKTKSEQSEKLRALQRMFITGVMESNPNAILNGSRKNRLPNNIHITFPGSDNERLMMELDEQGILCAAGSACSASSEEPSHVLKAIGVSDEMAQQSLRFTMGRGTTDPEVETVIRVLRKTLQWA